MDTDLPASTAAAAPVRAREPFPESAVLPPRRRGPNVFLLAAAVLLAAGVLFALVWLFLGGSQNLDKYVATSFTPLVERSDALGSELRLFLVRPPAERDELTATLERWADDADELVEDAAALRPPAALASARAYLQTVLQARAAGFVGYRDAILGAVDSTKTAGLVDRVLQVDAMMAAADRIYPLYADAVVAETGGTRPADSVYFPDPSVIALPAVKPFVERMVGAPKVSSGRDVAVTELTVQPTPEPNEKGKLVVEADGQRLRISTRVENHGERPEVKLAVKVELRDESRTELHAAVREIDLQPGESTVVDVDDLAPFIRQNNGLIVSVGPLPGETADSDNTRSTEFLWRD